MTRRRPRDRERLRRTAAQLSPPPDVDPYYVAAPMRLGQAPGWHWRPAGADRDEYLGHNVYAAETALQLRLMGSTSSAA